MDISLIIQGLVCLLSCYSLESKNPATMYVKEERKLWCSLQDSQSNMTGLTLNGDDDTSRKRRQCSAFQRVALPNPGKITAEYLSTSVLWLAQNFPKINCLATFVTICHHNVKSALLKHVFALFPQSIVCHSRSLPI